MMAQALHFRRVHLRRMAGVEGEGFAVDRLCPGINVIYGPNGCGKSRTAAALNARIGDTISLDPGPDRVLRIVERETWAEDTHARGRAFLKRYQRTLDQLS